MFRASGKSGGRDVKVALWMLAALAAWTFALASPQVERASASYSVLSDADKKTRIVDMLDLFVRYAEAHWIADGCQSAGASFGKNIPETTGWFDPGVCGTPSSTNLALNENRTAFPTLSSDGEHSSFTAPPSEVNDGDNGTYWESRSALGGGAAVCLVVDFGANVSVGRAIVEGAVRVPAVRLHDRDVDDRRHELREHERLDGAVDGQQSRHQRVVAAGRGPLRAPARHESGVRRKSGQLDHGRGGVQAVPELTPPPRARPSRPEAWTRRAGKIPPRVSREP